MLLAKAGHILPTIGPIDDWEPISNNLDLQKINLVDFSNITKYTLLNFPSTVSVLHTPPNRETTYRIQQSVHLSPKEQEELKKLVNIIGIKNLDPKSIISYNKDTLEKMRALKNNYTLPRQRAVRKFN